MQGGSRFSLTAGNNLFRITDPRDKSTSEITILKRGSIKNITVYDNSIDVPQLQLSPTFESGSRSFSVHTNNSHIVLNVHSEWGTCKLIKDGLEYTNCTNNTLASLMFGLNAYKIYHSIDGVYALNIYRGSNVLSITLTTYGKEGITNEIEPNIPLIPSFPYHRLVTNQFHAFLYVHDDDDDKEDPFFVKIQVGCNKTCGELRIYSPYTESPDTISGDSRTLPLYNETNIVTIEEENSQAFFIEIVKIWQQIQLKVMDNGVSMSLLFKNNIFSYNLIQGFRAGAANVTFDIKIDHPNREDKYGINNLGDCILYFKNSKNEMRKDVGGKLIESFNTSFGYNFLNLHCGGRIKYSFRIHRQGSVKEIDIAHFNTEQVVPLVTPFLSGHLGPYVFEVDAATNYVYDIRVLPNPDANDITFKINLNDKTVDSVASDGKKILEFNFDFSTIGSNGHATVHICGPVEGCYIILMYKKLEEFIFNNNNLGVTDNMNNQIVMDKIDDGTSQFTSKFHGSVQNANFVTYLGKGEESANGKLKNDSIEVVSLCTSALCHKQEILLLKSSNSTNLFSQSESVTNIDVPILDITLTKRVLIRENTISTFTIFSKHFSNLFQIDTNVNLGRLQGSKGSGNISIGSRSATTPSVYVSDGIRQNYKRMGYVIHP